MSSSGWATTHNTFSNEAKRYLRVAPERIAERGIVTQRRLLPGGTCEASAFVRLGWVATGIALPNTGYHNAGADDRLVPEMIRIEDVLSGIALSAEATVAADEDAEESWWPDVRVVPAEIRERLGRSASRHSNGTDASCTATVAGCRTGRGAPTRDRREIGGHMVRIHLRYEVLEVDR